MPQSLCRNWIHSIFSTKNRVGFLGDPSVAQQMHAYLAKICQELGSPAALIGGVEDHVHILCNQSKNICTADLIGELKRESSKWIKTLGGDLTGFYWQNGYGAFSVSHSQVPTVKGYIRNQPEHHRKTTFKDELREFLRKYELEYDERYVWD